MHKRIWPSCMNITHKELTSHCWFFFCVLQILRRNSSKVFVFKLFLGHTYLNFYAWKDFQKFHDLAASCFKVGWWHQIWQTITEKDVFAIKGRKMKMLIFLNLCLCYLRKILLQKTRLFQQREINSDICPMHD